MTSAATLDWIRIRRGLNSVSSRLRSFPSRIAYAGNSVTAQRDGYVSHLHESLEKWSGQPHAAIQAGLSGMGSMGCLFTLDRFVLSRAPDLCFLECTVGDCGSKPPRAAIEPVLEGIIRKLSGAGSACCIVHAYRGDKGGADMPAIIEKYERVAEHYGIPSIDLGRAITGGELPERWSLDELFLDGLHTKPKGAKVMADLAMEAFQHIAVAPPSLLSSHDRRLHAENLEKSFLLLPEREMTLRPDRFRTGRFRLVLPFIALEEGDGISIESAPADIWGLLAVAGPQTANVVVETSDGTHEYPTWDKWCDRDLLRTVSLTAPLRRGSKFRLLVSDRGGRERDGLHMANSKQLRLAGLLVSGENNVQPPAQS